MMTRPPATTAGFRITVRGRRIYVVDTEPTSDPGVSAAEARVGEGAAAGQAVSRQASPANSRRIWSRIA
jgi:hypothetical protein